MIQTKKQHEFEDPIFPLDKVFVFSKCLRCGCQVKIYKDISSIDNKNIVFYKPDSDFKRTPEFPCIKGIIEKKVILSSKQIFPRLDRNAVDKIKETIPPLIKSVEEPVESLTSIVDKVQFFQIERIDDNVKVMSLPSNETDAKFIEEVGNNPTDIQKTLEEAVITIRVLYEEMMERNLNTIGRRMARRFLQNKDYVKIIKEIDKDYKSPVNER